MIAVVGCSGGANLTSVGNALDRLSVPWRFTNSADEIRSADKVILPGVGAAGHAMQAINAANLIDVIRNLNQPVLGICLGMQLLYRYSAEGQTPCLGIIDANVVPFGETSTKFRIPHIGWNRLDLVDRSHPLVTGLGKAGADAYVYFVHSFHATSAATVVATSHHGYDFPAMVQHKNFFGCQFHPEKSAAYGEQVLKNFLQLKV